ncbi:hypothetical protein LCGC14_0870560 [marine sediment metagenome]|uniref:Uncharacterized protein n=1 Tax=marine sediment metagenome TaxID=412755 RepID=A0A0F9RPJ4_9ZZZZ
MFKNKKSQVIFVSLMVSVMVLILVVILSTPLKDAIDRATNGSESVFLNSSNPNLSVVHKATVITIDMMLFYIIGIFIASSISFVTGRRSFEGTITAIMVFIITSVLITPLKTLIVLARDSGHLDCASITSVGQSLSCIIVDIWLFYFVITLIATAITFIFVTKVIKK